MSITRRNVRSVLLQSLLFIFPVLIRISAGDEIEENPVNILPPFHFVNLDYNVPSLDLAQVSTIDGLVTTASTATKTTTMTAPSPIAIPTTTTTTTTTTTAIVETIAAAEATHTSKSVTPTLYYTPETNNDTPTATAEVQEIVTDSIGDSPSESTTSDFYATVDTTDSSTESDTNTETDITSSSNTQCAMTCTANSTTSSLSASSTLPSILLSANAVNKTLQYTNTSDPLVQYDLECRAEDAFCEKVSRAVGAAIDEFTRVVNVKNSLLIKVIYYSFCEKTCANDTMGWGTPTSQFTLPFEDGADLNYVYPQALAKQLAPYSSTSVWAKYDIEIEINHDVYLNGTDIEQAIKDGWNGTGTPSGGKYWFFNESGSANISSSPVIQPYQVDFRYVFLHELLHGLGFLSSWAAYFWTDASPFRQLVEGVIDPLELQLVTPGPYWYINQDTGPAYVTGFQPTMIFDKYLVNVDTQLNVTSISNLSDLAFEMEDFCVQNNDAFIVNFIRAFNAANQSTTAHKLWVSMSQPETVSFQFQPPTVANSSYNLIPYLNQTYQNITLLTGSDVFDRSTSEQTDATLNRPGLMISHLDGQYNTTPDFLMTHGYQLGQTLEDLAKQYYDTIPVIKYNTTTKNNSILELAYQSPIGPGILRILDSIGYSTVLTRTNYTTDGSVKTPKSRSMCDDSNTNHGMKPTPTSASLGNTLFSYNNRIPFITSFIISIYFFFDII